MDKTKNRLIIGSVCIVILLTVLITYLMYFNSINEELKVEDLSSTNSTNSINETTEGKIGETESASTEMGKTVEESEEELEEDSLESTTIISNDKEVITEENTTSSTSTNIMKEETSTEESKEENKDEEQKEPKFSAPVKGEIIREFASESLVYSNTLQEWITHNGIDIKADKTTVVTSAAKGTVYAIKNDPRYGLTVIINHDAGYQTVYSNLLTAEFVVEGEKVEEGQTIGTVGNTSSFEISDDYHLHFEILKNNKCIDPTICINF